MMAINHSLTGAMIGLTLSAPEIALPAAFVSHFALDAIPHYGQRHEDLETNTFRNLLIIDAGLCFCLVLTLALTRPRHWLVAAVCAFLAASPDFMWVGRYVNSRKQKLTTPVKGIILKFHAKIQWFQRPPGAIVEAIWLFCGVVVLVNLVR